MNKDRALEIVEAMLHQHRQGYNYFYLPQDEAEVVLRLVSDIRVNGYSGSQPAGD